MLRMIGGPKVVDQFLKANGIEDTLIVFNEQTQQSSWELQFKNSALPRNGNGALHKFYLNYCDRFLYVSPPKFIACLS